jgi:hypothetical protein
VAGIDERMEAMLERAGRFFMGKSPQHLAAIELARRLGDLGIDYAIAGALALGIHGHERFTTDVDVLVTREGHARFKAANLGRGYVEVFPGSKGLRDTVNDVKIDFILAGDYPGDGKPKAVAFPDPRTAAIEGKTFRVLTLEKLVELKLASGMSAAHRLKDLADVISLIQSARLPRDLASRLDPSVRGKFEELWDAASQARDDE